MRARNAYTKGPWSNTFTFNTNWGTGIDAVNGKSLSVYPNPANTALYVDVPATYTENRIMLYSLTGVLLSEIEQVGPGLLEMDISSYIPGSYILVLSNAGGIYRTAVVVE